MTSTPTTRPARTRGAAALALAVAAAGALVGATAPAAEAGSTTSQWGTISAGDGYLPATNRCGTYTYAYDLTPPEGNWAIEFFVTDPRGSAVSSWAALNNYSAGGTKGSTSFVLCRNNTKAGVFTISAKMSTDVGYGEVENYQMAPATFTLVRAPKAAKPGTQKKVLKKSAKAKKAKGKKKSGKHRDRR